MVLVALHPPSLAPVFAVPVVTLVPPLPLLETLPLELPPVVDPLVVVPLPVVPPVVVVVPPVVVVVPPVVVVVPPVVVVAAPAVVPIVAPPVVPPVSVPPVVVAPVVPRPLTPPVVLTALASCPVLPPLEFAPLVLAPVTPPVLSRASESPVADDDVPASWDPSGAVPSRDEPPSGTAASSLCSTVPSIPTRAWHAAVPSASSSVDKTRGAVPLDFTSVPRW
jgi:hypothetical protein